MNPNVCDTIKDILPDFETGNSLSVEEIKKSLKEKNFDIQDEDLVQTLEDMVKKGEIRKAPQPKTIDSDRYCKLPKGGKVKLPPNQNVRLSRKK